VAAAPAPIQPPRPSPADGALVALERVSKVFRRRAALRDVSLAVRPGSCVAVLGPNGAGKSTLLRVAAGLTRPSAGRVLVRGSERDAAARLRASVGYVAHSTLLYEPLTPRENLTLFARLAGAAAPGERAAEALRALDVDRHADRAVGVLSRGTRQRVALARALMGRPPLLLLDEPFAGLDSAGAARLLELLREARDRGAAILLATHGREAALELADEAAILAAGRLRHRGPVSGPGDADLAHAYLRATADAGDGEPVREPRA
jgi:heme ABC exporter ATP-binding subunit CcmA